MTYTRITVNSRSRRSKRSRSKSRSSSSSGGSHLLDVIDFALHFADLVCAWATDKNVTDIRL
jgi:hypothetical protein